MKKKIFTLVLTASLMLGCCMTANALSSATVTLSTSQYSAYSKTVGDSASVSVYAKNYSSSKHNVNAITYGAPAGGSFNKLDSVSMGVGTTMNTKTVKAAGNLSSTSYYLGLNPTAAFKNCSAYGSIKLK